MSHLISVSKVNQFLPINKLELRTSNGADGYSLDHSKFEALENTARDIIISKLSYRINTTSWFQDVNGSTLVQPPDLITNIMGMLVAGWVYDRQFAEEATAGYSYGRHKEREAYNIINGILLGEYKLDEEYIDDPQRVGTSLEVDPIFTMDSRI